MRDLARRHWPLAVLAAGLALFAASPVLAQPVHGVVEGPLLRYSAEVPPAASARVSATYDAVGNTAVTLELSNLAPGTRYLGRVHVEPCGPGGAGATYQQTPDPEQPSEDPAYANPHNEIWLDVETDGEGAGAATSRVNWQFHPAAAPRSVMLSAEPEPDRPTQPGPRLACLTVEF
jgi:Cu-Zn family superoxide dismutase